MQNFAAEFMEFGPVAVNRVKKEALLTLHGFLTRWVCDTPPSLSIFSYTDFRFLEPILIIACTIKLWSLLPFLKYQ